MGQVICHITNGKIASGRDYLVELLKEHEGGDVIISVDKFDEHRTRKQLNYYWSAMIKTVEDDLGWQRGSLHEHLKQKFLPIETHDLVTGELRIIGGSTRDLSKQEMRDYIMNCILYLGEAGIHVPEPSEYYKKIKAA